MQINPEVEITLSRSGRVLDIEGENADGKELVKDYEYKGKDKETVVDELADLAIEQQYLADAGRISIEVDARSDEWAKKMETEITDELNDPSAETGHGNRNNHRSCGRRKRYRRQRDTEGITVCYHPDSRDGQIRRTILQQKVMMTVMTE